MLINQSRDLMLYFDKLRISRNMTIHEFINDIVSERQYRRYIRGKTHLSPLIVSKFSTRVSQKIEHILLSFESERLKETQIINTFHNLIVNDAIKESFEFEENHSLTNITNTNNLTLYKFSLLIRDYKLKKTNSLLTVSKIKTLISYDKIINHTTFSSTEIIILSALLSFDTFNDHQQIITLLERYIEDNNLVISGHNDRMLVLALYHLMSHYGRLGDQERLKGFAKKAISINEQAKSTYLLEHFFYTLAYLYKLQNNLDQSNQYLYQCLCILYAVNSKEKTVRFKKLITKNFDIAVDQFMIDYIKVKLGK